MPHKTTRKTSHAAYAILGLLSLTAVLGAAPSYAREHRANHFEAHPTMQATMRQVRVAPVVVMKNEGRHHRHHHYHHVRHHKHHAYRSHHRGHRYGHHVRLHGGKHMDVMRFKTAFYHSR